MAKLVLPIDPFQITQGFGERPDVYKQFGLAGHNGWDIRTKYPDTPEGRRYIVATQDSQLYKKAVDPKGFGNYFEVITRTSKGIWKHTFAHCHSIEDFKEKKQGEPMAISNNTGFSTAAHLHWTPKRIRIGSNGTHEVINYNNGYFGAVNPQEYIDEVRADITISPQPPMATLPPELQKYSEKWNEIAVNKGFDVNSPQFASYREIDKILSDKLKIDRENRDNAIRAVGLDPNDLKGSLDKKLAEAVSQAPGSPYEKLGRSTAQWFKEVQNSL